MSLMCGRDDPPTSTKDLFTRFIASPMVPTNNFLATLAEETAAVAVGTYGDFIFDRGITSISFRWKSGWDLAVALVLRIPANHAVLTVTDTGNADETIVLAWNSAHDPAFTEYESEGTGPLIHRIPMYTAFKRALRQAAADVEANCVPPVVAMMTAFRTVVRMTPRFAPDVGPMEPTLVRDQFL